MPQVTLDGNAADTDKQHSGICQGGVTPPQPRGPMPAAGRDVTEVVCGVIRQQRYRMRRQVQHLGALGLTKERSDFLSSPPPSAAFRRCEGGSEERKIE